MKRSIQRVGGAAFLALTLAVTMAPSLEAQTEQEPRPVLGGHRFIWNPYTESPFPRTYVLSTTGGGKFIGLEFIPSFEINGYEVEAVKGDLLFAELGFAYEHQIQPWLGMWAKIGGLARLGTDAGALLTEGVNTVMGWDLGWLFKMYEGESFVISGTAAISNEGVTDVSILRWVRGVVDDDPNADLVASNPRLRGRGGLRAGWGINETFGLQVLTELGYGESGRDGIGSHTIFDAAASLSIDLYPATEFPIGWTLSGSSRAYPREGTGADRTIDASLRTAFTGRDNFLIALDTSWNRFDVPDGDDVSLIRAGLSLQLFF